MASELQQDSMDITSPGVSKASPCEPHENGLTLFPVSANESGEGLPYAPEDFPNPGDKWRWKVGKRVSNSGHYVDRYTYVPRRLRQPGHANGFASKLSLKQYVQEKFPDTNIDNFFASFYWKIPSKPMTKDNKEMFRFPTEIAEDTGEARCKAGNTSCSSLAAHQEDSFSEVMSCDICCEEFGFCRDCCCILCCRVIDKAAEGYNFIRCEANVEGSTCGHSCHIDCALRAYMAGTVGGSIGLDAEYYCRRCDSRTDLVSYVTKLLENCESAASRDEFEKILRVSVCVLRGSTKSSANELLHHIEKALAKLKNGTYLEDIWEKEGVSTVIAEASVTMNPHKKVGSSANANGAPGSLKNEELQDRETDLPPALSSSFDYRAESLKLEDEIDQTLDALRKSQKIEYRLAEERLSAQKKYLQNLYLQLEKERSDFLRHASLKDHSSLLSRVDQIKGEMSRLKEMEEVSKGFGKVPKRILNEQFGLDIED